MFGDLPMRRLEKGETGGVTLQIVAPPPSPGEGGGRAGRGRFGPRTQDVAVEVVSEHPREDAERLIRGFLAQAYRRPVEEAHAKRFLELFNQQFELGHGFTKSLLSTYTAILCSPGFLYVQEAPAGSTITRLPPVSRCSCGTRRRMTNFAPWPRKAGSATPKSSKPRPIAC